MTQLTLNEVAEVKSLAAQGLITYRKHPELDLYILNYTPRMQYVAAWTPVAEQCRGLIVDSDYNIIKRPFRKFYNLGERMEIPDLPNEIPTITEKIDGFLGILYNDIGQPAISTRGSFESPMAQWATQWIRGIGLTIDDFDPSMTYLFEIVEPTLCREQGLLVDYGDRRECILLAVKNTDTGEEIDHIKEAKGLGLPFAKEFTGSLDDAIKEMPTIKGTEQEGFVVKYSNAYSNLRVKLKGDEYKQLHRMLSGLTPKRILSMLIESGYDGLESLIEGIPDESYNNLKEIVTKIEAEQERLIEEGQMLYRNTGHLRNDVERAKVIHRTPNNAVAFAIMNGKDYRMVALKQVKKTLTEIMT